MAQALTPIDLQNKLNIIKTEKKSSDQVIELLDYSFVRIKGSKLGIASFVLKYFSRRGKMQAPKSCDSGVSRGMSTFKKIHKIDIPFNGQFQFSLKSRNGSCKHKGGSRASV